MGLTTPCENYAKTLTDSTFDFSITGEEIRGGAGNSLFGKYFHDSNLSVTLTDAMFNLEYIAASLGVNIESGGISVKEEELSVVTGGTVTTTETPIAFDGTLIGWYKLPTESTWSIGTISGTTMTVTGATVGTAYCVKYFYQNANARSITIKSQYVPSELHVTILNDLWLGGDDGGSNSTTTKIGRLITDIPRLQMDGNQNLALTASGAATVNLTGSALSVSSGDTCEEDPYYGTMTEEIFNAQWQSNVIALAAENSEIAIATGANETIILRAVYGGMTASNRISNSDVTFTVDAGATGATVSTAGVVTASTAGTAYVTCMLTNYDTAAPAIVEVTVT